MPSLTLSSPAKINLYLKVIKKNSDGFHEIKTIFERIDLSDKLTFSTLQQNSIQIVCDHPHVPLGKKNLIFKVAANLKEKFGIKSGLKVNIRKNIPVAAGLAGGSSNAATTLMALNQLWNLGLSITDLIKIGRDIGSDVPFFLHQCSWGLGTDRGDRIKRINLGSKLWHVIVVPKVRMYAWKVYGGLNLQNLDRNLTKRSPFIEKDRKKQLSSYKLLGRRKVLTKKIDNDTILIRNLRSGNILRVGQYLENDLESSIVRLNPRLLKLKKKLKSLNTQGVMISGSGPAVFGITDSQKTAQSIQDELKARYSQVFVARTL